MYIRSYNSMQILQRSLLQSRMKTRRPAHCRDPWENSGVCTVVTLKSQVQGDGGKSPQSRQVLGSHPIAHRGRCGHFMVTLYHTCLPRGLHAGPVLSNVLNLSIGS